MTVQTPALEPATARLAATPPVQRVRVADDKDLLRAARDLTKDISEAKPYIYWPDMLLSAGIGYAALVAAILSTSVPATLALGVISALALYRALLFIHELTHIHRDALPGFRTAWNLLVGIPMLVPSFMYEGVHTLHHKRTQYGTADDPEYLPLALMKPWTLPAFVLVAMLAPVAFLIRFGVLVPLGLVVPPLRRLVWERASALSINPVFRRKAPDAELRARVIWLEAGGALWALLMMGSVFVFGWRPLLITLAVVSVTATLNQLRTLVAHLWENEGDAMSVTAQYLDSVNVPPPGLVAELWAPVGLRYHALHHLLPSMPYHALPEAHRRLSKALDGGTTYHAANHPGLVHLVGRIARSTMRLRRHRA